MLKGSEAREQEGHGKVFSKCSIMVGEAEVVMPSNGFSSRLGNETLIGGGVLKYHSSYSVCNHEVY